MVASLVETPALKGIIYRFLLAHAERPDLLKHSKYPKSRKFAGGPSFYDDFVREVAMRVPNFGEDTEAKLLDTETWTSQADFKEVLQVFKDLSGIRDPRHFHEIGRVIPRVGDGLTALAATALNPGKVIQMSPRYNADFNNDQYVAVEWRDNSDPRLARARVQHYFLPSTEDPYLEMVTAAFGYWEGIPGLWGFPEVGSTNLFEVQMTIKELLERDYAYLETDYNEKGDEIHINGERVGRYVSLEDHLHYQPSESHIAKSLPEYKPVLLEQNVVVGGEVIFERGTLLGMPCNRYDVEVPHPSVGGRIWYVLKSIPGLRHGARAKTFAFLGKKRTEVALSDQLRATQTESLRKVKAEKDTAVARADAAEAKLTLEEQVRDVNRVFGEIRTLAHDNKNHCLALKAEVVDLLRNGIAAYEDYKLPRPSMFENSENLLTGAQSIFDDPWAPGDLKRIASYTLSLIQKADQLIENERAIMGGGIPVNIADLPYSEVVGPVTMSIQRVYPTVRLDYDVPEDLVVRGDVRLLKAAFANLVSNAVEASLPDGEVKIEQRQSTRGQRTFTIVDIYQSGLLPEDIAERLNKGESFTTKPKGNATGASASYNIIKGPHHGSIKYQSLGEEGGHVRVII